MARHYELTAKQFALIEDLLPARGKRGGRWRNHARRSTASPGGCTRGGAQWREVPERYGKWQSVYDRFNFWRADGTLDKILARLQLRLNEEGRLDFALRSIDATSSRASRSAAGAARGKNQPLRSR